MTKTSLSESWKRQSKIERRLVAMDDNGVEHRMWKVTDVEAISRAAAVLGPAPVYIADGHHRYETSCRIRDEVRAAGGSDSADYGLMMFISMHDSGLAVLPTHRLFRGLPAITSVELTRKIGRSFDVEVVGTGAALGAEVWESIQFEDQQTRLGLYCRADDTWVLASLSVEGLALMEKLAPEQSDRCVALAYRCYIACSLMNCLGKVIRLLQNMCIRSMRYLMGSPMETLPVVTPQVNREPELISSW